MARTSPEPELTLPAVDSKPFRARRPRLCAAVDCRAPFRPERRTQRYCSDRCRNCENQRRFAHKDEIQEAIVALRGGLNRLASLLSATE